MNRDRWLRMGTATVVAAAGVGAMWWAPAASAGGEACRRAAEAERLHMGPPLVCHPLDIGEAKSIPFGSDAFEVKKGYRAENAVKDTLGILKTEKSVLVRMETLRRATVYVRGDKDRAVELLAKLAWKALDAEAGADAGSSSESRAAAWFDAGYLAACLDQLNVNIGWKPGLADGVVGYAWMKEALALSGHDPEMEFAAAMATHPGMRDSKRDLFETHVRAAAAGADKEPLLAKNLKSHLAFWGESLDRIVSNEKDGARDASRQR